MDRAELQSELAECFEVRLDKDKLKQVYQLLEGRCYGLSQYRLLTPIQ